MLYPGRPIALSTIRAFFVKQGDGSADFKPIAHLYKTQVYQLAEYLGSLKDSAPSANHRHILDAANAGGVLLCAAL